jgi:hypothetical protein
MKAQLLLLLRTSFFTTAMNTVANEPCTTRAKEKEGHGRLLLLQ